jgi:hypothetical protein
LELGGIITIVTTLLPIIIDCFDPDDGPQAQEYVTKRFKQAETSGKYRGYSRSLARSMARRAKQAGRKEGIRLTWTQAFEVGFAALDDIRTGDTATASITISENHNFLLI